MPTVIEAEPVEAAGRIRRALPPRRPAPRRADLPEHSVLGVEAGGEVAASAEALLGTQSLQDGELVLLRIRPSLWFLPLTARWSLLALLALAVIAYFGTGVTAWPQYRAPILQCLLALAVVRLAFAGYLWATRWYVLTNRRVMWLAGGLRTLEFTALLTQIEDCRLEATAVQRLCGLGSLSMPTRGKNALVIVWDHIRDAENIRRQILDAVRKARNGSPPRP